MDRATLDRVLERHAAWLQGEAGGECANLRGANLRGADLRDANLRGAYLTVANFGGVDLTGADLRNADLRGAYLRDANLNGTDLRRVDLGGADLGYADLTGAKLTGARVYPIATDRCVGVDIRIYSPGRDRIVAVRIDGEVIVQIGCQRHPIGYWLLEYQRIGEEAGYPTEDIPKYGMYLKFMANEWGVV